MKKLATSLKKRRILFSTEANDISHTPRKKINDTKKVSAPQHETSVTHMDPADDVAASKDTLESYKQAYHEALESGRTCF